MSIFRASTTSILLFAAVAVLGQVHVQQPIDDDRASHGTGTGTRSHLGASLPALLDATLEELSSGLADGLFTSVDLVQAYTARTKETHAHLHAVTELNPDALAIAASLDAARREGRVYGPLHGIPVLVKNNIATADRMNTTAGSFALLGATVPEDSTAAARLRRAGAILLGKSNLSQWSDARSQNSSNGWSAHGGQTHGAYHHSGHQDPCGSSSGSAVAASLGLAWAALGTETSGSIQCPACFNNVVGIKPTVGLTSRYLVVPISEHQDTVGPLARTVKDAAYLLNAIAGHDSNDNYTSAIPFDQDTLPDFVDACQMSALQGKRVGVPRHLIDFSYLFEDVPDGIVDPLVAAFNQSLDVIRSAGALIVEDVFFPGWEAFVEGRSMQHTLRADLLTDLAGYLSKLTANPHNVTSLYDVQQFTRRYESELWPARDTVLFDLALDAGMDNTSPLFWSNRTRGLHLSGDLGLLGALRNHSLDAIVLPTYFALEPPAMVGSPAVTVPMGVYPSDTPVVLNGYGDLVQLGPNIPFGISFLGDRFSEKSLVGMAYAFEQRTQIRNTVKPYMQPKTELQDIVHRESLTDDELEL